MEPFRPSHRVKVMQTIKTWPFGQSKQTQFETLMKPHLKQLYSLAYRFTGQRADAEDLVQDVLLKLFPRLAEMQEIEKLSPWLARVLYRHFIDKNRSKQRSPLHLITEDNDTHLDTCTSAHLDPADMKDTAILQERLQHALNSLNEDQRILVILHDVEGYTLQEIHTMYDVSIGTLKSRINRARTRLRECLKNKEPFANRERVYK